MSSVISPIAANRRQHWIEKIRKLSGDFGDDSDRVEAQLAFEIAHGGLGVLIDHLRLCGDIPESFDHDSSEEKLYSKYTDALLSESFRAIGLKSLVLKERADAADVEAFATDYSFVADAKAFRLSRTAKNQKDFKIQAMDGWKRGKHYAMVVCPIHQLPTRASQIYQQASARNVCIFTYSHLAVLVNFAQIAPQGDAEDLLFQIFEAVRHLNPSKDATAYWTTLNRAMLSFAKTITPLWDAEKQSSVEAIVIAKEIALTYLASQREKIMRLSHQKALEELLRVHKIEARIATINAVSNNNLLAF